ncbi:MAG: L,D-transpeptidase family protein [Candidatus Contendobacter sp.]|nr:L,D-transpeptidase family protein [Candidatus Contendobacter sp.]MDG4556031.1 L,D-transpeptidase family protein [Candidatus Contendobacter sp.]
MSKRIIVSLGICSLLGACALNVWPVAAQVVGGPGTSVQNAAAPAVASLDASQGPAPLRPSREIEPTGDEMEPETPAAPAETAETVAAPLPLPPCPAGAASLDSRVAIQICQRVRADPPPTHLTVDGRALRSLESTIQFYAQREYRPGWLEADGDPSPAAEDLLKAVAEADQEGLRGADYRPAELHKRLKAIQQQGSAANPDALAEFDLLFTDTFLTYGSHLLAGRLPPRRVDPDWAIKPRSRDLVVVLREALAKETVSQSLRALRPREKGYVQLREVLRKYREVAAAGGWPTVVAGLASGAQGPRVRDLRARLQASGDLSGGDAPGKTESAVFDKTVTDAVRRFQKRHGLAETGTVNAETQAALNVSVTERIRQVELNLERWRWMPDDLGSRYILVNIPSFKMKVFEDDKRVIESNVVVGRQERQTPAFTANMAYLVLSPKWYVPRSIAVKDKLPQLKRSPYALARQNIRVFNSAGQEIKPGAINWRAVSASNFNYQLRQDAGPRNALGGIKFMFPNPYNVYLHDTPSRELFSRSQRTFSSGCIRISNPVELAEYLLKFDPKWTRETIKTASASGKQRVVNLPRTVPVYLLYWTAWVDEDGLVNFRNDIYQRDKPMIRALYDGSGASGKKGA